MDRAALRVAGYRFRATFRRRWDGYVALVELELIALMGGLAIGAVAGARRTRVVAWRATVAMVVGIIVGLPSGVVLGRTLWVFLAHEISVVPSASVPVITVALTVVGALLLGNSVATFPARIAARTPTALLLRAE